MPQESNREKMLKNIIDNKLLSKEDELNFSCDSCGNCCSNQNILLPTFDILKLRRELEVPTMEIIQKYVTVYRGHDSKMPLGLLKFVNADDDDQITMCPFLKPVFHKELDDLLKYKYEEKVFNEKAKAIIDKNVKKNNYNSICSIHKNSPEVCKLYPLGRTVSLDQKTKKQKMKYFMLDKKDLPCHADCYKAKNKVKDYLKRNDLDNPIKIKLHAEYTRVFAELSELARDKENKFNDGGLLSLYLLDFDLVNYFQRMLSMPKRLETKLINKMKTSSIEKERELFGLLEKVKKVKNIDFGLLEKAMNRKASDDDLYKAFGNLLDVYNDILVKLKKKYAKSI